MRIIFQGTPEIAKAVLQALIASSHQVIACYTQPDRAKGRGQQKEASPVKILAQAHNIPVFQPENFKNPSTIAEIKNLNADIVVVLAYGLILPPKVLTSAKYGCINIHASLLPQWRGASPISQAILAGDKMTGITLMQMDKGMDTGEIISQSHLTLTDLETTASLTENLGRLAQNEIIKFLDNLMHSNHIISRPQNNLLASYAPKITKTDALIDWSQPATIIARQIRAYNPWPVSFTCLKQENIKIWQAEALATTSQAAPGTIIDINKHGIFVASGQGILQLTAIQFPSKNIIIAPNLANLQKITLGMIFTK